MTEPTTTTEAPAPEPPPVPAPVRQPAPVPTPAPEPAPVPAPAVADRTRPAGPVSDTDQDDKPVVVGDRPAAVTFDQFTGNVVGHFTPPDLWVNARPPLQHTWAWARHGQHVPDDETARAGARVVACITIPFRAVLLYLDWLIERPSRFLAAAVLVFVLIQVFF